MYYGVRPPVFSGRKREITGDNGIFWFSKNGLQLGAWHCHVMVDVVSDD